MRQLPYLTQKNCMLQITKYYVNDELEFLNVKARKREMKQNSHYYSIYIKQQIRNPMYATLI